MASAAEQLASNLNWGAIGKATELKKRLWFTVAALVVFRIGAYIPVPGVDPHALAEIFARTAGGIAGLLDVFSGGSIGRMSVLALSIMPYISASIIMQILPTVVPSLEALKKEGEAGRKKINQYTRYGTVILATFQAYGIAVGLESQTASAGPVVLDPGLFFRFVTVVTLVGGTLFLMWLGEQITARGVGNGVSLIIFRRHRGRPSQRPDPDPGTGSHRRPVGAFHHRARGRRGARGVSRRLCRDGAATNRGAISKATGRQQDVWRRGLAPAAQDQHLGRDPADLRLLAAALPGDHRLVPGQCRRAGLGAVDRHLSRSRPAAVPAGLYRPDRLLLLLLHHGGVQPDRHGRQSEEERRLPAGQEHGRVPRIHPESADRDRRALPVGGLHPAGTADRPRRRAVLLRRHQPVDRGLGHARHGDPDPGPPACPSVRGADQEGPVAGPRPMREG